MAEASPPGFSNGRPLPQDEDPGVAAIADALDSLAVDRSVNIVSSDGISASDGVTAASAARVPAAKAGLILDLHYLQASSELLVPPGLSFPKPHAGHPHPDPPSHSRPPPIYHRLETLKCCVGYFCCASANIMRLHAFSQLRPLLPSRIQWPVGCRTGVQPENHLGSEGACHFHVTDAYSLSCHNLSGLGATPNTRKIACSWRVRWLAMVMYPNPPPPQINIALTFSRVAHPSPSIVNCDPICANLRAKMLEEEIAKELNAVITHRRGADSGGGDVFTFLAATAPTYAIH